jgi:hypothetical protein
VAPARTDISAEQIASIISVARNGGRGTMLAVTNKRSTQGAANVVPSSPFLVTLMMEAIRSSKL